MVRRLRKDFIDMKYFLFLFYLAVTPCLSQLSNQHWSEKPLQIGHNGYVFADNLNLRKRPSSTSEKLKVLKINTLLTIIEATNEMITLDGHDGYWVKVKIESGEVGYVPSTYISTGRISFNKKGCYLLYKQRYYELKGNELFFRLIENDGSFLELENHNLANTNFSVTLFNNKGLSGIDYVIQVNYLAEACGEEGGISYFTLSLENNYWNNLGTYSSVGDGGVYHINENLIFPDDPEGMPNTIIYIGEQGEGLEDENTYKTISYRSNYQWNNGSLVVPIKKFEYR